MPLSVKMAALYIQIVANLHIILLVVTCRGQGTARAQYPFQNSSLPWETRVSDLVGRLTLPEIASQTVINFTIGYVPGIPRLGIKPYVWSTECSRGQRRTNTTAFPQSLGLAASFNADLMHDVSEAISYEVRAHWNVNKHRGIYLNQNGLSCFSPVINIMRHPLWGRNQETYGEDPFLSGTLAQSFVRGLQGRHPRYVRVNAGCKHFDVHGGPENIPVSRFSFDAKVTLRDWWTTFLPQFKMCVDAGTYSLMCSYNSINGVPACANKQLLTDIARKDWGFTGYVVSDAWAISNIMDAHHYLNNTVDTVAAAIKAGCNLELRSNVYLSQVEAIKQKKLTEQEVRDNVKPLFYTRMRLGEFDPEDMNPYNQISGSEIQSATHRKLAMRAAMESFVLLKNMDNILPLKSKLRNLAIIGPMGNNSLQLFGDYASDVVPEYSKTPYQGLAKLATSSSFASGCDDTTCTQYSADDIRNAVMGTDLIIACLGTGQAVESEGKDRPNLDLPGQQLQLLQDAVYYGKGTPVILLLFNAGPLDITWAHLNSVVSAILECFFPAEAAGDALYNVLTASGPGSVPAGRLPATWPADISQVLPVTNYTMQGRTYRYYQGSPLYPFGYGLSYSRFSYSDLKVLPASIHPGDSVNVFITVQNLGAYDADEVIQVYMSWKKIYRSAQSLSTPRLQLVAFKRQPLVAYSTITVNFTATSAQMAVWLDDKEAFEVLQGIMEIYAGGQQPNQRTKVNSNVLQKEFRILDQGSL